MLAAFVLAVAAIPAPAVAAPPAPGPVEHLHKVVVDAIRPCPKAADGEIVVCSRDRGIDEGYRLPKLDQRYAGAAARPGGRGTMASPSLGAAGAGSCSSTGAGGATGCSLKEANDWGAWKKQEKADGRPFPW